MGYKLPCLGPHPLMAGSLSRALKLIITSGYFSSSLYSPAVLRNHREGERGVRVGRLRWHQSADQIPGN